MPTLTRFTLTLLAAGFLVFGGRSVAGAQGAPNPVDLLLTADDAGKTAVLVRSSDGRDERGAWARQRWERDRESLDVRTGPIVIDQMVFVASGAGAAASVFAEEARRQGDFPEAADPRTGAYPFAIEPLGDEVNALSACDDCLAKDAINLHHRVVVRKGTVVTVLYLFGRESVVTQELATWFAGQALARIPEGMVAEPVAPTQGGAAPEPRGAPAAETSAAPAPASAVQARPQDLAVKRSEAGKEAEQKEERDGSDDRGSWYEVRYERPHTYGAYRSGPVTIFNRVFVARSVEAARTVLDEQAALNEKFPEAKEKVGDRFELKDAKEIGEDGRGLSACTGSCSGQKEIYVHKRLAFRLGNVVSVVYLWGLSDPEGTTDWHARYFSGLVAGRIRG